MKLLVGILLIAAALQPYVLAESDAAAAAAAASDADDGGSAAAAAAAAAAASSLESDDSSAAAAAAAAAASDSGDSAASSAAAAAASSDVDDGVAGPPIILPPPAISCNCPAIYRPVCGTNGITYSNVCLLKCISWERVSKGLSPIYVKSQGRCPWLPCWCRGHPYRPVCGSDGRTYYNPCYLACENRKRQLLGLRPIRIVHWGPCKQVPLCLCPGIIIPVCGTDNVTYRNYCFLLCASQLNQQQGRPPIFLQNVGPCKAESCPCPKIYRPVCASNGQTFDNLCLFNCENRRRLALGLKLLTLQHYGACCRCPGTWDPVCASDGKTYRNRCILRCLNRTRIQNGLPPLTIQYPGVCGCNCNTNYNPVCGTDGKTYGNICLLQCEIKRRKYLGLPPITLKHIGPCVCNCSFCSVVFSPVCGSDGKTYWNYCWLKCHSDCNVKNNLPAINFVKFGYC